MNTEQASTAEVFAAPYLENRDEASMLLGRACAVLRVCGAAADDGVIGAPVDRAASLARSTDLDLAIGVALRALTDAAALLRDHHTDVAQTVDQARGTLSALVACHGVGHLFSRDVTCYFLSAVVAEAQRASDALDAVDRHTASLHAAARQGPLQ